HSPADDDVLHATGCGPVEQDPHHLVASCGGGHRPGGPPVPDVFCQTWTPAAQGAAPIPNRTAWSGSGRFWTPDRREAHTAVSRASPPRQRAAKAQERP